MQPNDKYLSNPGHHTVKFIATFLLLPCLAAFAQSITPPSPLQVTVIQNITATTIIDCPTYATCIDNRSQQYRRNNYHSFRATGSGIWSVQMQWADGTPASWTSFGASGLVTNTSPVSGVGYGIGYHDFISFAITGTTTISNYSGSKNYWMAGVTNTFNFPISVNQGGTPIVLADGTGATDSTAIINAALAALPSAGGALYLPTGQYKVCNVNYSGTGNVIIYGDGPFLTMFSPYGGFAACSNMFTIATTGSVTIHDIGTDMGFTGHSLTSGSNITITGTGSAGSLSPVSSVNLYNLYTANSKSVGIQCTACQNVDYHDSISSGNYFFGISLASSGTVGSPLYLHNFHVHGITSINETIGVGFSFFLSDITVDGNSFYRSSLALVQTPHAYAAISANVFDNVPTQGCAYDSQCGSISANFSSLFLEGASDFTIGVNHFANVNGSLSVLQAIGSSLTIGTQMELPIQRGRIDGITIDNSSASYPLLISGNSNGPNPMRGSDIKIQNTKLSGIGQCGNLADFTGFDLSNNSCTNSTSGGWIIESIYHGSIHNNFCHNCNTAGGTTYSIGTAATTQGSASVTGSGTMFTSGMVGGGFTSQGSTGQVCSYSSNTAITLCNPVTGAGGSGLVYSLYYGGGGTYAGMIITGSDTLDLQFNGNIFTSDSGNALSSGYYDDTGVSPSVSLIRYDTTSVCNGPCGAGLISPPPSFVPTFCPNCCGTNPAVSTYASNLSGGVTVGSGGVTSCTLDFSGAGFVNSPTCYFFPLVTATPSPIYITSGSGNAAVTFTAGSTDMSSVRISYQCSGTLADATWYPVSQ